MAEQQQRRKKSSRTKEKEIEWQERVVQIRRVTKVVKGG
ncbi:MAG: 30S ribosomal protein S5, partial [Trichodesmium sp. St19_bin2]|nr:30S ribosomal protein S5 [Trichodesmium sp. St19_bin2]